MLLLNEAMSSVFDRLENLHFLTDNTLYSESGMYHLQ